MLKKIVFIMLMLVFIIAGAVVSLATEDEEPVISSISVENVNPGFYVMTGVYEEEEEEYSHEAVIEMYSSLFFDPENETEIEYIKEKDIKIVEDGSTKDDIQDYDLYVTLSDTVYLEKGNTVVVMVFVQENDTYELLGSAEFNAWCMKIKLNLPNVGSNNPNYIRVIAFPKDSYKELTLDNVQMFDTEVIIVNQLFDFMRTLKTTQDIFKTFNSSIIPR